MFIITNCKINNSNSLRQRSTMLHLDLYTNICRLWWSGLRRALTCATDWHQQNSNTRLTTARHNLLEETALPFIARHPLFALALECQRQSKFIISNEILSLFVNN